MQRALEKAEESLEMKTAAQHASASGVACLAATGWHQFFSRQDLGLWGTSSLSPCCRQVASRPHCTAAQLAQFVSSSSLNKVLPAACRRRGPHPLQRRRSRLPHPTSRRRWVLAWVLPVPASLCRRRVPDAMPAGQPAPAGCNAMNEGSVMAATLINAVSDHPSHPCLV